MPFTANNRIEIFLDAVTEIGPRDRHGASSFKIERAAGPVYSGTSRIDAANCLRALPIGQPVEVRTPRNIRSCMNKPGLWDDVLHY